MARVRAGGWSLPGDRPDKPARVRLSKQARRRVAAGALAMTLAVLALYLLEVYSRAVLEAPAPTAILYDRNAAFITQVGNERPGAEHPGSRNARQIDYGYWPLARLPDRVVGATLALEDRRFYDHPGVDPLAAARAAWNNLRGSRVRSGASTIAMQIARMQRPSPRRSFVGKTIEAGAALALTWRYGREALLAHYLRIVPYGNGSHGIAHAARFYFDKPVADLSWSEIALLSAIPKSPSRMNPLQPRGLAGAVKRGHRILGELARQGVIGAAELALAHRQLAAMSPPAPPRRPDGLHAVLRLEAMVRAGAVPIEDGADPRLQSTIDLALQERTAETARHFLDAWRAEGAQQVAILIMARGSGEVLASVGSSAYGDHRAGAIDFTRTPRSPGSTLKPFIYALALEQGRLKPTDIMADLPEGASGVGNADGQFLGPLLPRQALANSRNVPATNLVRQVGLETTFRFLRDLGVHEMAGPAERFGLSMAIGSLPTNLDRLMRAYGVLADDGVLQEPVWFKGQRRGARRLLSTDTARLVTSFLSDPLARLPSFPRYGPTEFPFAVALKTGTSQGYRDAWTVAWSRKYMIGVWIGRGDAGTMNKLTGGNSSARLAHNLMLRVHDALPGDLADMSFPPPPGRHAVELCVFGGKLSNGRCGQTLREWVRPGEMPEVTATPAMPHDGGNAVAFAMPAIHRAWAMEEGYPLAQGMSVSAEAVRITITAPEHDSRLWLNPAAPRSLDRIALKAAVEPRVAQIVWYVDGEPFMVADPDKAVFWPATRGAHRFQARLPFQDVGSKTVRIVVE
jgi:penicillin-binding protein 1C